MKIYVIYPWGDYVCRMEIDKEKAERFCREMADREMRDYSYHVYDTDTHLFDYSPVTFYPKSRKV